MNDNLREAERYAALGWKVYPVWGIKDGACLCRGTAKDCKPGKHPWGKMVPHGGKDATTDVDKLKRWFPTPAVNVGIRVEGRFILDVEKHGMGLLREWEEKHGPMPTTPTVETGSGARHYYFQQHPAILSLHPPEKVKFVAGAELLVGGDVIAPPSTHKDGGRYAWLVPPETPLAEMPPWLAELVSDSLTPERLQREDRTSEEPFDPMRGTVPTGYTFDQLPDLPPGGRHDRVNEVVGSMLGIGYTEGQVMESGRAWAARQSPPYSAADLEAQVRFIADKESARAEGGRLTNLKRAVVEVYCVPPTPTLEADCFTTPSLASSPFAGSPAVVGSDAPPPPVDPSGGLPKTAYHGVIGEYVRAVEPLTEADPAGVLACVLAGVGSILGRRLHHRIGRRHAGNLFVLSVGDTSSRKGTCWDVAEAPLSLACPDWSAACVEGGFGSGQGFVYRIRDAQGEDSGVPDKRLLVVEEEFANFQLPTSSDPLGTRPPLVSL